MVSGLGSPHVLGFICNTCSCLSVHIFEGPDRDSGSSRPAYPASRVQTASSAAPGGAARAAAAAGDDPLAALLHAAGCSQYIASLHEMEFDVEAVRLADVEDLQECGITRADSERIMAAAAGI